MNTDTHNKARKILSLIATGLLSALCTAVHAATTVQTATDPTFGLPIPPRDVPFGLETSLYTAAAWVLVGLAILAFAIYDARRTKTALPIFVALSGVFCAIPEVFIDIAGACFWPYADGQIVYTILGRPMTWFPIAAWFAFGSVLAYLPYALFLRGAKIGWLWGALAVACVFDVAIEEIMLNVPGLYVYYGHQPMIFFTKFPAWWMFTNTAGIFLGTVLAWRFRASLLGWKGMAMFALTPLAYLGVFGFAAMPASIVINGDFPWLVTQAGGVLTSAMGLLSAALTIRVLLNRNPFEFAARVG